MRTGYKFFPYAAKQSGQWWVLRLNFGFPEHDMYTLFVDAKPVVDITDNPTHPAALVRSIAALNNSATPLPVLDTGTASTVISKVARYVNYGSEHGDPCDFCSYDHDGMTRM
ncbi:hypothetical protein MPRG_65620 [Mycobacterium paragordonae]|uniref:Uncharacterized protein n=2 Tax=Mycobacteriaceae TaxID=1762 RepID=A0ABQ1CFM2_9MYCO|nr:hypothetical protein MPRG_65620 [Mycobacterium paragordonae]